MQKLKTLIFSETFKYLVFGALGTLVYAIVKLLAYKAWQSGWGSETVAQAAGIIFAFFTNKIFVFEHKSGHLLRDFISFVSGRVVMLLFAILMNFWLVDTHPQLLMNLFGISKDVMVAGLNAAIQVIIIVVNYLYSKFVVFRKQEEKDNEKVK